MTNAEKLTKMYESLINKDYHEGSLFLAFCFGVLKNRCTKGQLAVIEHEYRKITMPRGVSKIFIEDDECWMVRTDWRGIVIVRETPNKLKIIRDELIDAGYKDME